MESEKLTLINSEGKTLETTRRLFDIYYKDAGWEIQEASGVEFIPPEVPSTHVDEPLEPGLLDKLNLAQGAERDLDHYPGHEFEGHDFK